MGKKKLLISSAIAAFSLAFLWQVLIRDTVFITFGVGRKHQKIEEFPYQCRRLEHPLLESCEDMVLDEESRTLFAACSSVASRRGWSPGYVSSSDDQCALLKPRRGDQFNVSARTLNDHVSVLNIDESGSDVLHGLQKLEISGDYKSATGGMDIDVHGIALEVLSPTRVRLWLNNHRTPVDHAGNALDATKVGANDTIEVFEYTHGSAVLEHVKTIVSDAVFASNNLHPTGHGGVLVTNDHNSKVGKVSLPPTRTFHLHAENSTVPQARNAPRQRQRRLLLSQRDLPPRLHFQFQLRKRHHWLEQYYLRS